MQEQKPSRRVHGTGDAGRLASGVLDHDVHAEHQRKKVEPGGLVKRVRVDSPPGFITNPHAIPTCTDTELEAEKCPAASQMGIEDLVFYNPGSGKIEEPTFNVYNMVPPAGSPADFAYLVPTLTADMKSSTSSVVSAGTTKPV